MPGLPGSRSLAHSPVAARFLMELPDGTRLSSTLLDVQPGVGFTDETVIEGNQIRVHHRISALPDGGALITYATEIEGPQAAEFGAMVTGDFARCCRH